MNWGTLSNVFKTSIEKVSGFIKSNPILSGTLAGAGTAGAILGGSAIVSAVRKKRKRSYKRKSKSRKRRKSKSRKSHKRNPRKKIKYTRTGQPYIILSSGKARFISKRSAKTRKKRKGGYY